VTEGTSFLDVPSGPVLGQHSNSLQRSCTHILSPSLHFPSVDTDTHSDNASIGVASGNGKDRRSKEAEFDEF